MRNTRQKTLIFEELRKHSDHPAADEIYNAVRKILPNISLGTVYRNLEAMASQGKILKIEQAGGQKRFDPNPDPHPHFRCMKCGCIEDVPYKGTIDGVPQNGKWIGKRKVFGVHIEFFGLCMQCNDF